MSKNLSDFVRSAMHPDAQRAQAWLRGHSDALLGKSDAAETLFPESGQLREAYQAGRLTARA